MSRTRTASVFLAIVIIATVTAGCAAPVNKRRRDAQAIKQAVHNLTAKEAATRLAALDELTEKGARAVPHLERAAASGNMAIRKASIPALGKVAKRNPQAAYAATEALLRLLLAAKSQETPLIAVALDDVGKPAVPILVRRMLREPKGLQEEILAVLIRINPKAATDDLIERLKDPTRKALRYKVIKALRILTKVHRGYDPTASPEAKEKVVQSWIKYWESAREGFKDT